MPTTHSSSDSSSQTVSTEPVKQPVGPHEITWRSGPLSGLICGLLAAGAAWLIIEMCSPMFGIPESKIAGLQEIPAEWVQHEIARRTLFSVAVLGASLGLLLGAGEGIRRSLGAMVKGIILGGVFGGAFGALAAWVGLQVFDYLGARPELMPTIGATALILAIVTGGVGLGLGIVFGRSFRMVASCTIAGLLSGVFAGICYTTLLSAYLPNTVTDVVLPVRWMDRAIWLAMTTVFTGVILTGIARNPSRR